MSTPRKFWLFIALVLALVPALIIAPGCEKKKPIPTEPPPTSVEEDAPDNAETRCFEGDLEACDELGH